MAAGLAGVAFLAGFGAVPVCFLGSLEGFALVALKGFMGLPSAPVSCWKIARMRGLPAAAAPSACSEFTKSAVPLARSMMSLVPFTLLRPCKMTTSLPVSVICCAFTS